MFPSYGISRPGSTQQRSAARPRGDPGGQQPATSRRSRWPSCSGAAVLGADMKETLLFRQGSANAPIRHPCTPPTSQRSLPGCAAFRAAPVTTHHAQPEPHQRPKDRRHDGVPPQRPGEGPEQELESDPVGVLDDEDQQDPEAGQRRDRPTTQFSPVRLLPTRLNRHHVLLMSRSTGGFSTTVCRLEGRLHQRWPRASKPNVDTGIPMTDRSARLYVPACPPPV